MGSVPASSEGQAEVNEQYKGEDKGCPFLILAFALIVGANIAHGIMRLLS